MTRTDALAVLAHMAACWPWPELTDEQVEVWVDHLRDVTAGDGAAAARRLEREDQRFPAIARFREMANAERRAREHAEARVRGLPEPEPDFERNIEQVRRLRATLALKDGAK